jgi:site-specific DNA-cytosine methylase
MKYSSIIPLIGGESIAVMNKLNGQMPEEVLSYTGFVDNDSHYINYLRDKGWEGKYTLLDEKSNHKPKKVDIVNTVCPCAGLSSLSQHTVRNEGHNDWMFESAHYVLGKIQPRVFWGENAPRLAMEPGKEVVAKLRDIGKEYGYTFSIYKTKSLVQGYSQIRDRTFYFFWKGDQTPLLDYIHRPHELIEDTISNVVNKKDDPMSVVPNQKKPSDDPVYKYFLNKTGMTHAEFVAALPGPNMNLFDYMDYIGGETKCVGPNTGKTYAGWLEVLEHLKGNDDEHSARWAKSIERMVAKQKAGGSVMRKSTTFPKGHIGAFVGHYPSMLTHPVEDRYLTYREMLSIMYLPEDFELLHPKKFQNHICQNVPVKTAEDMMEQVIKFCNNRLDLIDTDYILQDNKRKCHEYAENSLQLDQFMV